MIPVGAARGRLAPQTAVRPSAVTLRVWHRIAGFPIAFAVTRRMVLLSVSRWLPGRVRSSIRRDRLESASFAFAFAYMKARWFPSAVQDRLWLFTGWATEL